MGGFSLGAIAGAVVSLLEHVGKIVVSVIVFVAVTNIFMGVLPSDPFRGVISSWASFIVPYGAFINCFIPVKFIASSTLFVMAVRYFTWIYKKLYAVVTGVATDDVISM